jgi:outer membrane protein OmpA-like peptidoglycan-associated protein
MRLIKNHDTGASNTHRQIPSQEASAVNTILPDAELDELFSFHDDPDFLVGCAQGRAKLRQLVLGSSMLENDGSVADSGTATVAKTSGVETTAQVNLSTLHRPWSRRVLAGAAAMLAVIACAIGISRGYTPPEGLSRINASPDRASERIVVAVPGDMNESPRDLDIISRQLRFATTSGADHAELVTAGDGPSRSFRLAPPPDHESPAQRQAHITAYITGIMTAIQGAPTSPEDELDLLETISHAVRGNGTGTLVLVSSGLSTRGDLDLRQIGWNADPQALALRLRTDGALPNLTGWNVTFVGLGNSETYKSFLDSAYDNSLNDQFIYRSKLTDYWKTILSTAGASSVNVTSTDAPTSRSPSTLTDTPTIFSISFVANSAELAPDDEAYIRALGTKIYIILIDHLDRKVTIAGYTADAPGSTPAGRQEMSLARARTVAGLLATAGIPTERMVVTEGSTNTSAIQNGVFDEGIAAQMRRVDITL